MPIPPGTLLRGQSPRRNGGPAAAALPAAPARSQTGPAHPAHRLAQPQRGHDLPKGYCAGDTQTGWLSSPRSLGARHRQTPLPTPSWLPAACAPAWQFRKATLLRGVGVTAPVEATGPAPDPNLRAPSPCVKSVPGCCLHLPGPGQGCCLDTGPWFGRQSAERGTLWPWLRNQHPGCRHCRPRPEPKLQSRPSVRPACPRACPTPHLPALSFQAPGQQKGHCWSPAPRSPRA